MTYGITEPCIGTKDQSRVEVCPVDCIYDAGESKECAEDEYILEEASHILPYDCHRAPAPPASRGASKAGSTRTWPLLSQTRSWRRGYASSAIGSPLSDVVLDA